MLRSAPLLRRGALLIRGPFFLAWGWVPALQSSVKNAAPRPGHGQTLRQLRPYPCEHVAKHLRRQYPRIGVVTRAMVAVVKFYSARLMHRAVRKRCCGVAQAEYLQHRFMRHPA